jgi:hypothetical protein
MSLETLRTTWRRVAPYVAGIAVLGSIGLAYAGTHGRSCCGPGSPCCHAGAPCCHGHAPDI